MIHLKNMNPKHFFTKFINHYFLLGLMTLSIILVGMHTVIPSCIAIEENHSETECSVCLSTNSTPIPQSIKPLYITFHTENVTPISPTLNGLFFTYFQSSRAPPHFSDQTRFLS